MFGLSKSAAEEVRSFCGTITTTADRYTGDIQAVALGRWDQISQTTKKELAELAKKVASAHVVKPLADASPSIPDVSAATRGSGSQAKLAILVTFASHTDVKLLINYNADFPFSIAPRFLGAGLESTQSFKWGKVTEGFFVDTSKATGSDAGFIKIEINLP